MGLDQQTQDIDGHKWTVTQFPARAATKFKVRIAKMIGPAIGELIPAFGAMKPDVEKSDDAGIELAMIPKVLARIAENVDEDVFVDTLVELMSMSTRDDTQITEEYFDIEFAGNDAELYKAIWFILKVNYSDFISMVETAVASTGLRQMVSKPETPTHTNETSKE